jgi:hypothetical protein
VLVWRQAWKTSRLPGSARSRWASWNESLERLLECDEGMLATFLIMGNIFLHRDKPIENIRINASRRGQKRWNKRPIRYLVLLFTENVRWFYR